MSDVTNDDEKRGGGASEGAAARSATTYPAHGLEEAIRFAAAAYKAGGNDASADDVRSELGLRSKSSAGWSYRLSAAKEFGVVERSGRAEDMRIRVTDLYKRYAFPEDEIQKRTTLVAILMRPPLYVRLLEKYRGAPVPPVDGVANLLGREYGVIESMKQSAAKAFIASLRFAQVVTQDGRVVLTLPSSPPAEATTPVIDPPQDEPVLKKAEPVVERARAPEAGAGQLSFQVSMSVTMAEITTLAPDKITAFFSGIAAVMKVKAELEAAAAARENGDPGR